MSEGEKEREREKRKESKRGRGGRERREMSVHYSCLLHIPGVQDGSDN